MEPHGVSLPVDRPRHLKRGREGEKKIHDCPRRAGKKKNGAKSVILPVRKDGKERREKKE